MIKADMIPKEAVEAARKFMHLQALSDEWIDDLLAAAINAWPGVVHQPGAMLTKTWFDPGKIILPLKENTNDKT